MTEQIMMNAVSAGRPPVLSDDARQHRILAAAEQVFDLHGYGDTTMEEVAQVCGMSKKTLYKYFPDKLALFNALIDSHEALVLPPLPSSIANDPKAQIEALLRVLSSFVLSPRQMTLLRLVISEARKTPELAERFYRDCVEHMLSLFVEGLPPDHAIFALAGGNARVIADFFLGATIGPLQVRALMLRMERDELDRSLAERVDAVATLLLRLTLP
jgi:AcrR family transcriptional regulator